MYSANIKNLINEIGQSITGIRGLKRIELDVETTKERTTINIPISEKPLAKADSKSFDSYYLSILAAELTKELMDVFYKKDKSISEKIVHDTNDRLADFAAANAKKYNTLDEVIYGKPSSEDGPKRVVDHGELKVEFRDINEKSYVSLSFENKPSLASMILALEKSALSKSTKWMIGNFRANEALDTAMSLALIDDAKEVNFQTYYGLTKDKQVVSSYIESIVKKEMPGVWCGVQYELNKRPNENRSSRHHFFITIDSKDEKKLLEVRKKLQNVFGFRKVNDVVDKEILNNFADMKTFRLEGGPGRLVHDISEKDPKFLDKYGGITR